MGKLKVKKPVKSDEEIKILFDAIAQQIVDAKIYYRLLCDLIKARKEDYKPFAQAETFWILTHNAIQEAYMIRLCRIMIQNHRLWALLVFLKSYNQTCRPLQKPISNRG